MTERSVNKDEKQTTCSRMSVVFAVLAVVGFVGLSTGCQHATGDSGSSKAGNQSLSEGESSGQNGSGAEGKGDWTPGSGEYDPCGGKTCGEKCQICPPGDKDCIETAAIKYCQPDGTCKSGAPQCKPEGGQPGQPGDGYAPCGGKTCGETCTQCAPGDKDCAETDVVKYCTADGNCIPRKPRCGGNGQDPGSGYDPCAGKTCGATCTKCAPGDNDCAETDVIKYCQPDGNCSMNKPQCKPKGTPGYDPCAGKTCGAKCTKCAPGDTDCVETAVVKYCHADGTCHGRSKPQCK